MKKVSLYLAGNMRGRQFYNFPKFDWARDILRGWGHDVLSPADIDRSRGFDGLARDPEDPCTDVPVGFDLDSCILSDVSAILSKDGVCFIDPEWYLSKGARAEAAVAIWRGKRLFRLLDLCTGPVLEEMTVATVEALCYHKGGLSR